MASWRDANPGYDHRLFDNRTAWEFLVAHVSAEAARAFQRAVDVHDRCLAPLGADLEPRGLMVYQESLGSLGANFVAAAPQHPVVLRALALAVEAVNRGDHDTVWLSTGPGLLTRAFAQELAGSAAETWSRGVAVLETHELHRMVGVHCPADYKRRRRRAFHIAA
jgi:hypothetical protein